MCIKAILPVLYELNYSSKYLRAFGDEYFFISLQSLAKWIGNSFYKVVLEAYPFLSNHENSVLLNFGLWTKVVALIFSTRAELFKSLSSLKLFPQKHFKHILTIDHRVAEEKS